LKENHDLVLKVWLKLPEKDCSQAFIEAQEILKSRLGKQPTGKTCGSFFKNPALDPSIPKSSRPAGYLLDQCDCKGLQIGQARVSMEHANWIINLGGATQKDVITLSAEMKKRVKDRFGIELIPEVYLLGA
jgi:UDP-N-acetylmuramate dehydrogenase